MASKSSDSVSKSGRGSEQDRLSQVAAGDPPRQRRPERHPRLEGDVGDRRPRLRHEHPQELRH
jgi:hypothetical protein